MPKWVVLRTTQGKSLANEILSGTTNGPLKITRIIACRKGGMSTSKMLSATKEEILKEDRYAQDLKIINVLNTSMTPPFDEEGSLIVGQLRNDLISEDIPTSFVDSPNYNSWHQGNEEWELCQIAVFAKTDSTNEILFMLAQDKEPDTIPIKNVEQGGNIIQINYTFNVLNSEDFVLKDAQLNTSGYVTAEMYIFVEGRLLRVENDYLSKSKGGDIVSDVTSSNNSKLGGFKIESDSIKYKGVELEDTLNKASRFLSIHDKDGNVFNVDTDNVKAIQIDSNYVDLELTQPSESNRKLRIDKSKQADNANQFNGKDVSDFVPYNFCKNDDFDTKILSGLYTMTDCLNSPSSVASIYWGLIVTVGSRNNDIGTYIGQTAFSVGSSLDSGEDIYKPVVYIRQGLNPFPMYNESASLEYSSYTNWGEWVEVSLKGHTHSKNDIEGLVDKKSGKITVDFAQYAWDANKLNGKPYNSYVTNMVYHSSLDLNNPSFDKAYITVTTDTSIIPNTTEGSSGYWHLIHFPYSNGSSTQFAMPFGTNKVYTRSSKNNIWSDWVSLITSDGGIIGDMRISSNGIYINSELVSAGWDESEYGSYCINNIINIENNKISISYSDYHNDENSNYTDTIVITPDGIEATGDHNGTLRNFDVEGYESVRNVTTAIDWNELKGSGLYHIKTQEGTNRPVTHHGLLYVDRTVGTPFQLFIPDGSTKGIYKRSLSSNTWTNIIESLPANGGNADTVGGKSVSELQNYNNLANKPASLKSPYSLIIQGNGTTLTNGTYDGSSSKTVNITPSAIGAASYTVISNGDFNEVKTPGLYTMKSCSNPPSTGNYWGLLVLKSDTGESYFQQIAFKESSEEIWIRKNSSTTWKRLCFTDHTHIKSQITDLLTPIIQEESSTNLTTISNSLSNGDILMLYS